MKIAIPDPLIWQSGIEFGLQAIGNLVREGASIEFAMLDHGPMLEAATFGIIEYQMQANVRWVSNWPRSFTSYDVALFPRVEALETATIMSILNGDVTVLSSDPVFSMPRRNFHYFPRRDWQALANILTERLAHPLHGTTIKPALNASFCGL